MLFTSLFLKRNSIQSKMRVYLRHVCENCSHDIINICFLFLFWKSQKRTAHLFCWFFCSRCTRSKELGCPFQHFRISKIQEEEVYFGEPFGFTLDLQKETANLFPLNKFIIFWEDLLISCFFQNTEVFAGNILKPFDTVLNLVIINPQVIRHL